ncbi:polysaccharide deacetylase family protein [Cerasicoccus maritimus]|uniref:polysaccharide deacetylase family protein n=1 Tax=Cerasicoccus maritimus TaxID=490089 RepID=UPI002852D3DC|nr:polysaccharide deacetylase family protein [Cerasicoccus maritimus]
MKFPQTLIATLSLLTAVSLQANDSTFKRIKSVDTDQPLIALTFDDGPNQLTPEYLKLFKEEDVKATFFWKGKSVASRPELAKRILAEGHEAGNHSYNHPHFNKLTDEEALKEVMDTQAIIQETTGYTPVLFRAPYILYTPALMSILEEQQLQPIDCNVGVKDWDKSTTVELIIERATTEKTKAGTIMLMHDWSPKSLEALRTIIPQLKEQGYQFVTVSELLKAQKS